MNDAGEGRFAPGGRGLAAAFVVGALCAGWGLARHPGFQPAYALRLAAPLVALVAGGAYVRLVASARSRIDGEREFDRGGKALFMGFVMVAATFVAWLLVSQAIPSALTSLGGTARTEAGVVTRRVAPTTDADCRFRLEVASAATPGGALPRPLDECVDEAVWKTSSEGGPVWLQVVGGPLGAELAGVRAAAPPR